MNKFHIFLGCGLLGWASQAEAQNTLVLHLKDASTKEYAMEEIRSLTFPSGRLSVNKNQTASEVMAFPTVRGAQFRLESSPLSVEDALETAEHASLRFSPNPITGESLRIQLEATSGGTVFFNFLDVRGQLVKQVRMQGSTGKNEWLIDTEDMRPGVYLCLVRTNNETASGKIIKY